MFLKYHLINSALLQLFSAAADVLRRIGEDGRIIQDFIELGSKAKAAASDAMDTEAVLGDIPDEFLDPIQVCLFTICQNLKQCHAIFSVFFLKKNPLNGTLRITYFV